MAEALTGMRRSFWISAAVFLVLSGVAWFLLRPSGEEEARPFFALSRAVPDTLVVSYFPETSVLVPDSDGGWRLVAPVRDEADGLVVEALLKRVRDLHAVRTYPLPEARMDTYGMRHPRGAIRAAYADGNPSDTLVIGGFTLDAGLDYIRVGNRPEVGLVDASMVRAYFLKSTFDLRQTRLLPFHPARTTAVRVWNRTGDLVLDVRRDASGWSIEAPFPGPGETKAMDDLLAALSHLDVRRFVRESEVAWEEYGLDPPAWRVEVSLADGDILRLDLGDAVPGTEDAYARRGTEAQLLAVSGKYPPLFERDTSYLRRKRLLPFGLSDVDSVRVEAGGHAVLLPGPAWGREARTGVTVREVLAEWILLEAETIEHLDAAASRPAGSPEQIVWMRGGDTLAIVRRGPLRGDQRELRIEGGADARPAERLFLHRDGIDPLWEALLALPGPG